RDGPARGVDPSGRTRPGTGMGGGADPLILRSGAELPAAGFIIGPVNRRICLILIAAAMASSCNRGEKSNTIEIALVTKALDSEWWQRVKAGADEAARKDPAVRLAVLAPEREVNIDQQVSILEDQITKKVAAIAVAPAGVAEILPVLDKAKAAGIPVVIM